MIGDNLSINVALRSFMNVKDIQHAVSGLKLIDFVKENTFSFENKEPSYYYREKDVCSFENRFYFDFEGNDSETLAYFSISFYTPKQESKSKEFSISAFNFPAGCLINERSQDISNKLKDIFTKLNNFDFLLFVNDSEYQMPELMECYRKLGIIFKM